jgi:hypothetical protein
MTHGAYRRRAKNLIAMGEEGEIGTYRYDRGRSYW